MTTSRVFWDAIARAKRALTLAPEDNEAECRECGGTGLTGGEEDAPICIYCDGSGVW